MGCINGKMEAANPLRVDHTHFELYRVVGRGAFGKVNAVKHRETGQLMAMKRCFKDVILRDGCDNVVWQERTIMASIHSPFLVNLLYSFQTPVELFLVMPFMSGGDLSYHLSQRRIPEDAARFYLAEMVLGLEELHSLGYVYRDLKPANVLMDEAGHVRVSDFGLAKRLRKDKSYLHTGYAGTRGYAAPEMVSGGKYTFGTDFFSLGAVAYELMHGRRPFSGDDEVLDKELSQSDFSSKLSAEAVDLVRSLCTKNPHDRLGFSRRPGGGWSRVKAHPFFRSVDWAKVLRREVPPPYVPPKGIANCSGQFEAEDQLLNGHLEAASRKARLTADEQEVFANFSFNTGLFDNNAADLAHKRGRSGTVSVGRAASLGSGVGGGGAGGGAAAHAPPRPTASLRANEGGLQPRHEEKSGRAPPVHRYRTAAEEKDGDDDHGAAAPLASPPHRRRRSISEYIKEKLGRTPSRSPSGSADGVGGGGAASAPRHHRKNSAVDEVVRRQMGVFDDETAGPVMHLDDDTDEVSVEVSGARDCKSIEK